MTQSNELPAIPDSVPQYEAKLAAELFVEDAIVYVLEAHVTRSGRSTYLRAFMVQGPRIVDVSWLVARYVPWKYSHGQSAVKITDQGGMDLGWLLVDELSQALRPNENHTIQHVWL